MRFSRPLRNAAGVLILPILLAACVQAPDPARTVEAYFQALVAKDQAQFIALICPEWEADAMIEFDAFGAVEAELDGVSCRQAGSDGDFTLVECQGSIVATYRGEDNRVFDLSENVYRLVMDGGEWRMCGYDSE